MSCTICGCHNIFHGSQLPHARRGTYLSESGCHDGVWMDDDEHAEGWDPDAIYRPCPNNPGRCMDCDGRGKQGDDHCPACDGTGWKGATPKWPTAINLAEEAVYLPGAPSPSGSNPTSRIRG